MTALTIAEPTLRVEDARGRLCPIPTVMVSLAMDDLAPGDLLDLWADDPVTRRDLPAWCAETGCTVVEIAEDERSAAFRIRIRK
jgi:TusA-related sulfurtransferase